MQLPIVSPAPLVLAHALVFRDLFENRRQFQHFQNYLTGLIVLPNKSLANISRCILNSADKTNVSRFFSQAPWVRESMNDRRLVYLLTQTKRVRLPKRQSVFILDDTLCEHVGSLFDYIDRHYNHGEDTFPLAHNPVTSHYVSGPVRFPVELRLYRRYEEITQWETFVHQHFPDREILKKKKERAQFHKEVDPVLLADPAFQALHQQFRTKIDLALDLLVSAIRHKLPFRVVLFDSWYLAEDFVAGLCRTLGVSPSGYYAWRRRPPSARLLANQHMLTHMRMIHREVHETYGSPRMHAELVARGLPCNVKRVARLMRLHHLRARHKRKYRVTTKVNAKLPVAPNHLAQQFQASAPNEKWVSDITYVWTREGWLYLAVVMDLYSRRIIGWALARTSETPLVVTALQMAIGRRQPPTGIVHHSDRGSQYASAQYQMLLRTHQFTVSMSGTGNCYDNAAIESFFGTLKAEWISAQSYQTRESACHDIVSYIVGFYNATRRHSALGYRSPLDFEQTMAMA